MRNNSFAEGSESENDAQNNKKFKNKLSLLDESPEPSKNSSRDSSLRQRLA